jgi:transcriptional regulator with XRE-family HTH domain
MECESWVFRVNAYPGESLGHFLGKFRRANVLSHKSLAEHLGIREKWVEEWESPSKRRNPTSLQRIALSKLMDVEPERLVEMLPPERLHLQTRLCAVCYAKTPVHRTEWQRDGEDRCDAGHYLLNACPACQTDFRTPALWEDGLCERCGLAFSQMQKYQRS